MRIFVAGDTHGNTRFLADYLYTWAQRLGADVLLQLGDFGFWEHTDEGAAFLDRVGEVAASTGTPCCFLRGNHDNIALLRERYGTAPASPEGFWTIRRGLYHIPDGRAWQWAGRRFRAFGGAYSVDKQWRLDLEAKRRAKAQTRQRYRRLADQPPEPIPETAGTVWFPDEELTDDQYTWLLGADDSKVDILLSHDKPAMSNPGLKLKDEPGCRRNQQWLQRAVVHHRPDLMLHGHLHHPYADTIRSGDDNAFTKVVGLGCDDQAGGRGYRPTDAWCLLDLAGQTILTFGADAAELHRDTNPKERS